MYAYNETYVGGAQQRLGTMFDTAVYVCGYDLGTFFNKFLESSISQRFSAGDPAVIAGRSGRELVSEVLGSASAKSICTRAAEEFFTPTVEYWTGWALAYYQWATGYGFPEIDQFAAIEDIRALYHPYHEMDIRQFCDRLDVLATVWRPGTNLQTRRLAAGLSQGKLARAAKIPVRTLQQYEQRQKDINHARVDYVCALARVLHCAPEDLLEKEASRSYEYAVVGI